MLGVPSQTICVVSYLPTGAVYTHKGCVVHMDGTTSFANNTADHAGGEYLPLNVLLVISITRPEDAYDPPYVYEASP